MHVRNAGLSEIRKVIVIFGGDAQIPPLVIDRTLNAREAEEADFFLAASSGLAPIVVFIKYYFETSFRLLKASLPV